MEPDEEEDVCYGQHTKIVSLDVAGNGGAKHEYLVRGHDPDGSVFAEVHFQNGPIGEFGVNGCQMEDLLEIVKDRLCDFQAGEFACLENALALSSVDNAICVLRYRTFERNRRGVEGKNLA